MPFNVKVGGILGQPGGGQGLESYNQVNRANNKILYEDPLERRRRERELRIQ